MIQTKAVYHLGIPVNNLDRAVKFYKEILGMEVAKLGNDDMGKILPRAEMRCGKDIVVLFQRPQRLEGDFVEREGALHHAFLVSNEDFEVAEKNMSEWGVQIYPKATVNRPSTKSRAFYFFDTEGNLLQLYTRVK